MEALSFVLVILKGDPCASCTALSKKTDTHKKDCICRITREQYQEYAAAIVSAFPRETQVVVLHGFMVKIFE